MTLIKICGITREEEADFLNEAGIDFAGFIQFYPKSKRNIPVEAAERIMKRLDPKILTVAVTVSPTEDQVRRIEQAGFSLLQVHGELPEELLEKIRIPVLRAFNGDPGEEYRKCLEHPGIYGFVLDAAVPGSGRAFDWNMLAELPRSRKPVLLAGGLTPENAGLAVASLQVDGLDTSTGVENDNGQGKSREKILAFVQAVRRADAQKEGESVQ